ncbi:histidinol-phosphate transaminase [Micromonospora sp. CPCC 206060]|uniref:histidinol-phosphate transaminase n=1 Tax=Micromonospora sp. CPCC 206060 TaxID=3122406 RepID=UPI002FEF06FB
MSPEVLHDLSMNETPQPPLPSVRRLVEQGATGLNRYPDNTAGALLAALAGRLGVPAGRILVGPGSAGLCQHLLQALGRPGDGPPRGEIVHAALSFEAYPLLIANAGARPVPVPMAGYGHDLVAMADAVTANTRAVIICNPNNPTGAVLRRAEIEAFLDRIPPEVTVVVDEAYREFVTAPDVPDLVELARDRGNVCVLRTFSKAYGLATLRVGYAVVPEPVAAVARMVGAVFFPGGLGQAAAVASLDPTADDELRARCAQVTAERARLGHRLRGIGLPVAPSEANFVWLPLGAAAQAFTDRCRSAGILVRGYPDHGVRITVGTAEQTDRLCAAVGDFAVTHLPAAVAR